jgi:hypothetical protein
MNIRKILTAEQIEQRNKKRTRILTILMLVLLLGSTAGYSFFSGSDNTGSTNNNGEIQQVGNQWVWTSNGQQFAFSSSPDSAKEVNISSLVYDFNSYYQKTLYIASNDSLASYEIASTLGRYASRVQGACYGPCLLDLPQKNCTTDLMIIYNGSVADNSVYQKDNCVFINGNITAVDAFLYNVVGLI